MSSNERGVTGLERVDVVAVDDDEGVRWILQQVLSLRNIPHRVAGTAPEGLRLIQEYKPRLAIVDVKLGAMNGLDLARQAQEVCPGTEILFITGYMETVSSGISEEGIVGVVQKPFDLKDLLSIIEGALKNSN